MSNSNTNRERKGSEFEFDVYAQRPRVAVIKCYRCDGCNQVLDERQIDEHLKTCMTCSSFNNFIEISTDEFLEESKDPFSLPLTYIDDTKKPEEETPIDEPQETPTEEPQEPKETPTEEPQEPKETPTEEQHE